jgi:hypothetical protein
MYALVSQGLDLIWYGDSVSEHFLGTDTGVPTPKTTVVVWEQHYSKYRSACFSLSHDRSPGLLWRVINGEAPEARMAHLPLDLFSSHLQMHCHFLRYECERVHACACMRLHAPCMHLHAP